MSENDSHIIHRQVLEARLPSEADAIDFQQRISQLYETEVPKVLGRLFDKLELGEELLRIPRLEIDLGALPPDEWEHAFVQRCKEELEKALIKKKREARVLRTPDLLHDTSDETQLLPQPHKLLSAFFEFLRFGSLKSPEIAEDFGQFENRIIRAIREAESQKVELRQYLASLVQGNNWATERLAKQFSLPFIQEMAKLIWELKPAEWQQLEDAFQRLNAEEEGGRVAPKSMSYYTFVATVLRVLFRQDGPIGFGAVLEACNGHWKMELVEMEVGEDEPDIFPSASKEPGPHQEQIAKKPGEAEPLDKEGESASVTDFFIENGGLVIVAPFLPALFQELELTEEKAFVGVQQQEKAIQLCQFLATGAEQSPEFLLPLNKLLCGWPLAKPLSQEIGLSPSEKEEAERMLEAAIQHWGAVGQSSVAALRETFLQRKATLRYRAAYRDWHLHLERRSGIDILVERIPWTISLIKLPWMAERIQLEWV